MCTGFVKRGNDVIVGFNMDIDVGAWDYKVYAQKDKFYIGMTVEDPVKKFGNMDQLYNAGQSGKDGQSAQGDSQAVCSGWTTAVRCGETGGHLGNKSFICLFTK